MHTNKNTAPVAIGVSVLAIVAVFVVQARLMVQPMPKPNFSLEYRNIAFGYHSGGNLCQDHTPDGVEQSPEECDDGNASNLDACLNTCIDAACGDGYVRSGVEECDDGDTSNGDGCSSACEIENGWNCSGTAPSTCAEVCGDGVVTSGEECDDGNTSSDDGCSSSCVEESGWSCTGAPSACETECGDGILAGDEQCDDGNDTNDDACTNACTLSTCGDGEIQQGETCDDSGESATCDSNCTAVVCGDSTTNVTAGEECDDGNSSNTDACVSCRNATCGDGFIRSGFEQCDPPGVGTCSAICTIQTGIGGGSQTSSSSSIVRKSPPSFCGNGVVEPAKGEKCDEGSWKNRTSPTCDPWCGTLRCGDGWVHPESEECEPERDKDGSYVVRTCGERSCTIPQCDEFGMCIGGCRWIFLQQCRNTPLEQTPASSASGTIAQQVSQGSSSAVSIMPAASSSVPAAAASPASSNVSIFIVGESSVSSSSAPSARSNNATSRSSSSVGICGNALVEGTEECDDGNANSDALSDTCRTDCRFAHCGDGVTDSFEQCDDGNDIAGDGCTPECTIAVCGNGFLELGEECDEGIRNSDSEADRCSLLCLMPRCGDGVRDPGFGEECDFGDGNSDETPDTCRLNCTAPRCGDGVTDSTEQCDDGNQNNADGCSNTCALPLCGNKVLEYGESCDDGNRVNGDGCNAVCAQEARSIFAWLKEQLFSPFRLFKF